MKCINIIFGRGNVVDDLTCEETAVAFNWLYTTGTKIGMFYFKNRISFCLMDAINTSVAPKLLENRYMFNQEVLLFRQRHFLFEIFDKKIQQLLEAHLMDSYLFRNNMNLLLKKFAKAEQPYKVLTLGELEAGFVVSTAPLILSLVMFWFEWIARLKDLLVVLSIFKTYFKIRHMEQEKQFELNAIKMAVQKRFFKVKDQQEIHRPQNCQANTHIASNILSTLEIFEDSEF